MKLKKWYLVCFISVSLLACKKAAPKEEEPKEAKLTTEILTKAPNGAQHVWSLFSMEIKYLSASGAVDSTYAKGPIFKLETDWHMIRFSIGPDVTTGEQNVKLSTLQSSQNVLDRVFPNLGYWTLSEDGKTLTCTKYTAVPRWVTGGDGGTFSVEYKENVPGPFPLPKALGLKITQSLPNNRKAEASFIFAGV